MNVSGKGYYGELFHKGEMVMENFSRTGGIIWLLRDYNQGNLCSTGSLKF